MIFLLSYNINLNLKGRGASGVVYRATLRGTEVAVKQILTESVSKEVVNEFELESAVMAYEMNYYTCLEILKSY